MGVRFWGYTQQRIWRKLILDFVKKNSGCEEKYCVIDGIFWTGQKTAVYRKLQYWFKLKKNKNYILSNIYKEMLHVCDSEPCCFFFVKQLLNDLGYGYIWDCQECFNENLFLHEVKQKLNDWFIQKLKAFFRALWNLIYIII